jgi:predicted ester cyclase
MIAQVEPCRTTADREEWAMSLEEQKELSRRLYLEVFGAGNMSAADEILAPDCISHAAGAPPRVGTDGIKKQAALLRGMIPDIKTTLEDQLAEGDRVASRWRATGTTAGMPAPSSSPGGPAGNSQPAAPGMISVDFTEIRIDRFENGRIVESWFIPDRATLWEQLGMTPAGSPPGAPAPRPNG